MTPKTISEVVDDIIHEVEAHDFNSKEARNVVRTHLTTLIDSGIERLGAMRKNENVVATDGANAIELSRMNEISVTVYNLAVEDAITILQEMRV